MWYRNVYDQFLIVQSLLATVTMESLNYIQVTITQNHSVNFVRHMRIVNKFHYYQFTSSNFDKTIPTNALEN